MNLFVEPLSEQAQRWPAVGRVILAQFDGDSVVVYQAYRPEIGRIAAAQGFLRGAPGYSESRMTWIKTNFLWMMYRSGWGAKPGQEVTLAIRVTRHAFDRVLAAAVPSHFDPRLYPTEEDWRQAVISSDVRLQWDPDHGPAGDPLPRRAIQLGVRGDCAAKYAREWIMGIEDISDFVNSQRELVLAGQLGQLMTPWETVYTVATQDTAARLGLDQGWPCAG